MVCEFRRYQLLVKAGKQLTFKFEFKFLDTSAYCRLRNVQCFCSENDTLFRKHKVKYFKSIKSDIF